MHTLRQYFHFYIIYFCISNLNKETKVIQGFELARQQKVTEAVRNNYEDNVKKA